MAGIGKVKTPALEPKGFPGPAILQNKTELLAGNLVGIEKCRNGFLRSSRLGECTRQKIQLRAGVLVFALQIRRIGNGGLVQVASVEPIKAEWLIQDDSRAGSDGEKMHRNVEKNQILGKRNEIQERLSANRELAGGKKRPRRVREASSARTVESETIGVGGDGKFASIGGFVDANEAVAHGAGARIFFEGGDDGGNFGGRPPVVAVEEGEDFAAGFGDADIESGDLAAVFLANVADAWQERADDFRCAVGGTVVDDDNFHLIDGKVLIQNALERLGYEAFMVIGVDEDGDKRRHDHGPATNLMRFVDEAQPGEEDARKWDSSFEKTRKDCRLETTAFVCFVQVTWSSNFS